MLLLISVQRFKVQTHFLLALTCYTHTNDLFKKEKITGLCITSIAFALPSRDYLPLSSTPLANKLQGLFQPTSLQTHTEPSPLSNAQRLSRVHIMQRGSFSN